MRVSIVIRTYNESRYLPELLDMINAQVGIAKQDYEIVLVDSGSTDNTLCIAKRYGVRVVPIRKEEFSFGRSLNIGCAAAEGEVLVFVSGHCVPSTAQWLEKLVAPVENNLCGYSYGRQIGRDTTKYSEGKLFEKFYPDRSEVPSRRFFVNNANASISRRVWKQFRFDESLTGLEDMELAKRILNEGHKLAYVADAPVFHIHNESWRKVMHRYEREARALEQIMPEIRFGLRDFLYYFLTSVGHDSGEAFAERRIIRTLPEIVMFRAMQYWGTFLGHQDHRRLSSRKKRQYFYAR